MKLTKIENNITVRAMMFFYALVMVLIFISHKYGWFTAFIVWSVIFALMMCAAFYKVEE
jgi:hypothetical protein